MVQYRILQPLSFHAGALLGLTEAQAHVRRAVLRPLPDGVYEVITEAQFKSGEVISFDGDIPKAKAACAEALSHENSLNAKPVKKAKAK